MLSAAVAPVPAPRGRDAHDEGQLEEQRPTPQPLGTPVAETGLRLPATEHKQLLRGALGDVEQPCAPFGIGRGHGGGMVAEEMVDPALAARVYSAARRFGTGVATLCHVAFAQVVSRASARSDVVFGTA